MGKLLDKARARWLEGLARLCRSCARYSHRKAEEIEARGLALEHLAEQAIASASSLRVCSGEPVDARPTGPREPGPSVSHLSPQAWHGELVLGRWFEKSDLIDEQAIKRGVARDHRPGLVFHRARRVALDLDARERPIQFVTSDQYDHLERLMRGATMYFAGHDASGKFRKFTVSGVTKLTSVVACSRYAGKLQDDDLNPELVEVGAVEIVS